jgi:DNA-binding LacI/PurR family transcriptional regulator
MGKARPTIEDVARAAGVSRASASRVINDAPGTSGLLRQRVHLAVATLGYQPNETARALASGRQRSVDLVAVSCDPDVVLGTDPYYSRILAGMVSALENADVGLRIHLIGEPEAAGEIDAIAANATAGAILSNITPALATRFYRRYQRVVALVPTAATVPAVEADNAGGAYRAIKHLHDIGCRRIAAIHGPTFNTCAVERRAGYRRALHAFGLPQLDAEAEFVREGGFDAARRLLDQYPDIDGMFVACDMVAAGAIQAITATGRRVPQDISVIGFDDSVAAICTNPPLTTMRLPVEQMAAAATGMLLSGSIPTGHRERFPIRLILRDSTIRSTP